jgi:Tfp pilus assembly protein PilF
MRTPLPSNGGDMGRSAGVELARRCTLRVAAFVLLSITIPAPGARAAGEGNASVVLNRDEVPVECKVVDGIFATDLQTQILYDYSAYEGLLPVPRRKEHQSFECGGQRGTLFWFAYPSEEERRKVAAFARGVLWGEDHPTPMHPELVLDGGPLLVVVSFRQAPAALVAAVQRRLSGGTGARAAETPSLASEELARGAAAYRAGDMAGAEKHLRAATRLAPDDLRAFQTLGHFLYGRERFADAVAPYERALEIDRSTKVLDRNGRRVLVDQLGMSYGASGRVEKARAIFEEGVRQDPEYPLFHYNLACAHAELGDLDRALASLRNALQRKEKVLAGESFPDPRRDSSFQRYVGDARFRKLLQEHGY